MCAHVQECESVCMCVCACMLACTFVCVSACALHVHVYVIAFQAPLPARLCCIIIDTHSTLQSCKPAKQMPRAGQNRIYTPYMTVHLVISLPKTPYIPINV